MTYTPPMFPAGLRPGASQPSAKPLQAALKKCGYLSRLVLPSDKYGPFTEAAVKRFHKAHPRFGTSSDGAIGPKGWAYLFTKAYGGAQSVPEPAADYHRVIYGGYTVNVRTKILMQRAEAKLGFRLVLSQGSYNAGGVSASAGTHDGGGVIDVSIVAYSVEKRLAVLKAMRQVGFAGWIRSPAEGNWPYHLHACAIGDREMAPSARNQVASYFNGRNGLANNATDSAPLSIGRPYPSWATKYRP